MYVHPFLDSIVDASSPATKRARTSAIEQLRCLRSQTSSSDGRAHAIYRGWF